MPVSSFYECDADDKHSWTVDVKGHRLPPLPNGCKGGNWVLKNATGAAEAVHATSWKRTWTPRKVELDEVFAPSTLDF